MNIFKKLFSKKQSNYKAVLKNNKQTVLCAFLIETSPDPAMAVFENVYLIPASEEKLKEKIRQECHCYDAEVLIIPPKDWRPPLLKNTSQIELTRRFPEIISRVMNFLKQHGRTDLNLQQLIATGNVITNPVTGKVFFVCRIEPEQK